MKLELEIDGQRIEADFTTGNGAAQLTYNGQTHQAVVSQPEPRLFVVVFDNHVYRCEVDKLPGGTTEVLVNGKRIPFTVHDKKRLRGNAGAGTNTSGRAKLSSPMPGKVVRVLCSVGDEVTANQGVLIVEAMKMQNEVQSPKDGKVKEIKVIEGQTVNAGETLIVIE